jgi:beta-lactamase superfamily II metal-dependent hydrolase
VGLEVDFLPVGKESKSGDAIVIRYGDLHGPRATHRVVVIDGGFSEDGEVVADHLEKFYGTNLVDLVISTHPDQDHISGLETLLSSVHVNSLWMHRPWMHSQSLNLAKAANFRGLELAETTQRSFAEMSQLEAIAEAKGIPIAEPFTGLRTADRALTIIGPTVSFYESLLSDLQRKETALETVTRMLKEASRAVVQLIQETLNGETLTDSGSVSPLNNSSVVSLLEVEGQRILFTADAGIPALDAAITTLEESGNDAGSYTLVQVPHHGSRRNVGPTVLDRMLGSRRDAARVGSACVSSAVNGAPKHPSKQVTNAFLRRGYPVFVTAGRALWHSSNAPERESYATAEPMPFHKFVEYSEDD